MAERDNPSLAIPSTPAPEMPTEPPVVVTAEVDWPPAVPQGPSEPADTPGWKDPDDLFPATEAEGDMGDMTMEMD